MRIFKKIVEEISRGNTANLETGKHDLYDGFTVFSGFSFWISRDMFCLVYNPPPKRFDGVLRLAGDVLHRSYNDMPDVDAWWESVEIERSVGPEKTKQKRSGL